MKWTVILVELIFASSALAEQVNVYSDSDLKKYEKDIQKFEINESIKRANREGDYIYQRMEEEIQERERMREEELEEERERQDYIDAKKNMKTKRAK